MITEIFEQLDEASKQRLMIGFENEFAQHAELPEGKYIGVNLPDDNMFDVIEQNGVWSYGELKDD